MVVTHFIEIGQLIRIESESMLWPPRIVDPPLEYQMLAVFHQPMSIAVLYLLASVIQKQRFAKRIAETDVRQPSLLQLHKQRHVIERRIKRAVVSRDASRQHRHLETQGPEQRAKGSVQLITEAASPTIYDLAKQSSFVKYDGPAKMNVEILTGNG